MRRVPFATGEFYHIYNRGIDKRTIFEDAEDMQRFFQSMVEFNVPEPIGSIYEYSFIKSKDQLGSPTSKLVNFICYCLNSNHYHLILEQVASQGIEKFMHRLGTGYTKFFNNKHKRSGSLFQGKFKSVHIDTNEYLLHLSAYVNLNDRVHALGSSTSKWGESLSSWSEYTEKAYNGTCSKNVILDQFQDDADYRRFATQSLEDILVRKKNEKELQAMLLE